jgi:hypothetical protein
MKMCVETCDIELIFRAIKTSEQVCSTGVDDKTTGRVLALMEKIGLIPALGEGLRQIAEERNMVP